MKRIASTLSCSLALTATLASLPASAHEADDPAQPPERTRAPTYDPAEFRSDQYGAVEFRVGPYRPHIDTEFGPGGADGGGPFRELYANGGTVSWGFEVDWQTFRIPHVGTIGPGIGWNLATFSADSLRAADPSETLPHPTRLMLMPMYAIGVFRVDVLAREFNVPFVPYAKGGFALGLWHASDAGSTSMVGDVEGKGLETGLQFMLGGMLHLNWFARQRALDLDNSTGVNHAYLFFEWMVSDLNSFGKGMQMGTNTWVTGVTVEF